MSTPEERERESVESEEDKFSENVEREREEREQAAERLAEDDLGTNAEGAE